VVTKTGVDKGWLETKGLAKIRSRKHLGGKIITNLTIPCIIKHFTGEKMLLLKDYFMQFMVVYSPNNQISKL
jgi:hypothetical protein